MKSMKSKTDYSLKKSKIHNFSYLEEGDCLHQKHDLPELISDQDSNKNSDIFDLSTSSSSSKHSSLSSSID